MARPNTADLNPIEQTFAQIKHWMRNAQKREIDDLWRHLGSLIDTIEPQNAPTTSKTQDTLPSKYAL